MLVSREACPTTVRLVIIYIHGFVLVHYHSHITGLFAETHTDQLLQDGPLALEYIRHYHGNYEYLEKPILLMVLHVSPLSLGSQTATEGC